MKYKKIVLKRGNTIVLEADLNYLNLEIDIADKLCVEIICYDGQKLDKVIESGQTLMISNQYYAIR